MERKLIKKPKEPRKQVAHAETRYISAHVDPEIYLAFKELAKASELTTEALMIQALDLLFKRHSRPVPPALRRKMREFGLSAQTVVCD